MTSVQERLQLKREPIDKWSIREQLCLASAVCRSGDQNWMSVSRALKPFGEPNRPLDWFHQKNCAAQYGMLLGNVETPKRKNKKTCIDSGIETPAESILKRLVSERQVELKKLLVEEKNEYQKLQKDMIVLQSGKVTEEQLDRWCQEIEEEENRKEHEIATHAQWLKEREHRKLEIEKVWRPVKAAATGAAAVVGVAVTGQKRKNSDVLDNLEQHVIEEVTVQHQPVYAQTPEPAKPALSPLLTSLLKSPSQAQSTPILHTAITNRPNTNTNPMIASLLNSSTGVTVSPGLQQLVSSAIGQETPNLIQQQQQQQHQQNIQYQQQQQILQQQQQHHQHDQQQQQQQQQITNDILDDANMANIKIEDLANSILSQDGPLPEIKKEEVDDIISEIIQADPERHLQLDNNGDININLELDDFDDDDDVLDEIRQQQQRESIDESKIDKKSESESKFVSSTPIVDPFEFQEDPVIHLEPSIKVSGISKQPQYQQQQSGQNEIGVGNNSPVKDVQELGSNDEENFIPLEIDDGGEKIGEETTLNVNPQQPTKEPPQNDPPQTPQQQQQQPPPQIKQEESPVPGSVEIVEVVVTDDDEDADVDDDDVEIDVDKNFAKSDIVNSIKSEDSDVEAKIKCEEENSKDTGSGSMVTFEESSETSEFEVKKEIEERASGVAVGEERADVKIEFNRDELLFDEINMEVKFDKSGKKRDYSRTKKKDEKGFDILLAIEKAHFEESEQTTDETFTDTTPTPTPMTSTDVDNKKDPKLLKIKSEIERSNSPWTEEEDGGAKYGGGGGVGGGSSKRRYSTPVTPTDSIPNSPASSNAATFFDEDREHRNWKKSVMLVYNRLATHKYASLFLKPITDDHAPGYSNTVYRPMDLLTIKKNIENGTLRSTLEFKRDAILMFMNALMYNRTNSLVYTMALEMQQECTEPLEILMMAENHKDSSLRRETRTSELGTKRKRTLTDEILMKSTTKKRKDD